MFSFGTMSSVLEISRSEGGTAPFLDYLFDPSRGNLEAIIKDMWHQFFRNQLDEPEDTEDGGDEEDDEHEEKPGICMQHFCDIIMSSMY